MKLILEQDVKSLGRKGEVVEVSEGYARNFLLPRKLAVPATNANVNMINQQKASEAHKQQKQLDEAKLLASQIGKLTVTIMVKLGEGGKIFGSVTSKDVADALKNQHGVEIDKRKIELKDSLKNLGTYSATIKLHPEVNTAISVKVVAN